MRTSPVVTVDPGLAYPFGPGRVSSPRGGDEVWYVTEETQDFSLLSSQPGAQILAQTHPLSDRNQRDLVTTQMRVIDELAREGRSVDFNSLGGPLVVFTLDNVPGISHADLNEIGSLNAQAREGTCLSAVNGCRAADLPSFAYVLGSRAAS